MSDGQHSADRRGDWRRGLPVLTDGNVTLQGLQQRDASSLLAHVRKPAVLQYVAPCPGSVEGFRRFVRWTHAERRRGRHACYGIIPAGETKPVGIIQLWPIERDFSTAEWGFVLGDEYWGTGVFVGSARLLLDFAFGTLGVTRLEARAVDANGRGNGVLLKLGATREGVLRRGFRDGAVVRDHIMWSILADEWATLRRTERKAH
jgi:ribosomal-protein-alanine N-acetyltransferase